MKIVCLPHVREYGAGVDVCGEIDLTQDTAIRLLAYRPLVASCQSVDRGFAGIEFEDVDYVTWGHVYGMAPRREEWSLYPPDAALEYCECVHEYDTLVVTTTGVRFESGIKISVHADYDLTSPDLDWDVIEEVAAGRPPDLPQAPAVDE